MTTKKPPYPKNKALLRFATTDGGYLHVDPVSDKVVSITPGNRRALPPNTDWASDGGRAASQQPSASTDPNASRPLYQAPLNNRGNSEVFDPNDLALNDVKLVNVIQSPRGGGEDAEALTVTFGREVVNQVEANEEPDGSDIRYTALLEWGIGNTTFNAEIDWEQGKIITLPASFVSVTLKAEVKYVGPDGAPIEKFAASFAYGSAGGVRANGAKLTRAFTSPTSDDMDLVVPPFATHVGFMSQQDIDGVSFVDAVAGSRVFAAILFAGTEQIGFANENSLPIPNGAKVVRIIPSVYPPAFPVTVVFSISL